MGYVRKGFPRALSCFILACLLSVLTAGASAREPLVERTLVFPRTQPKYVLHRNYLHGWLDRPLFHDPGTFYPEETRYTLASYRKVLESARDYGVDGMAILVGTRGTRYRHLTFPLHEAAEVPGMYLVPEFSPADTEECSLVLEKVLPLESAARIDGKLLVTSYRSDFSTPEQWKETLAELRRRHGDSFIFLPDTSATTTRRFGRYFEGRAAAVPESEVEAHKRELREYLDVCDGIYFQSFFMLREQDPVRFNRFNADYYRFVIDLYREVLSEPEYRGKYFGLSAGIGHINENNAHMTMNEDGTRTLRKSFELATEASPDVIIMPEWDEANENTSVQPTVYNSFSARRIIKYYMHRIKGEEPEPNEGDDLSVPNLIVSYRKNLKAGEALEVELVNVPDSPGRGSYEVSGVLKDTEGRVVRRLGSARFKEEEMGAERFIVPSEELIDYPVLIPSFEVRGYRGRGKRVYEEGLLHIELSPTWTRDYKWVKQPLRDVIRPEEAVFEARVVDGDPHVPDTAAGAVEIEGEFSCGEEIASVEVISDGTEIYAYDVNREYLLDDKDMMLFRVVFGSNFDITYRGRTEDIHGSVRVREADFSLRPEGSQFIPSVEDDRFNIRIPTAMAFWLRKFFILVPREDVSRGVLEFDLNKFRKTVRLSDVAARGLHAEVFGGGLYFGVERYGKLPAHPFHIEKKDVSFSALVYPENMDSALHMRVITKSGRIYRSAPIMPFWEESGEKVSLPVYSRVKGGPVEVRADRRRIPDLTYEFDPENLAILPTGAGRYFYSMLGAGPNLLSSGIGGGEAGNYSNVFHFYARRNNYPADAMQTAPERVVEDGSPALRFDGKGTLISFPGEALPRGAFTLQFEIKPASGRPCTLFYHHGYYTGILKLDIDIRGHLVGSFIYEPLGGYGFSSSLRVPAGEWSKVEVKYDLDKITLSLNGREEEFFPPVKLPWFYHVPSVFGGFGSGDGYFEGYLRSFRIVHNSL